MDLSAYRTTFERETTYWWYVARLEILDELLERSVRGQRDMRVLNLGCGTGATSERFSRYGRVVSLDYAREALDFGRERGLGWLTQAHAQTIPFVDESFDVVIALDVLEHLDDDAQSLREIWRVLRPNGTCLVTVPAYDLMWSGMDDVGHHRRRYVRKQLVEGISGSGLETVEASYFNTLLFPVALLERMLEKVCGSQISGDDFLPRLPECVNSLLSRIFSLERHWLEYWSFPFGLSIMVAARRAGSGTQG